MSTAAVENALKAALAEVLPGIPKAWPNQDFDPSAAGMLPYIACDLIYAGTSDITLDGEQPILTGSLIATIVVARGSSTTTANGHADTIAAAFPMGRRITAGGKVITILQPPHTREGMPDGAYWRVPVRIRFQAE